jgi:choline kinase
MRISFCDNRRFAETGTAQSLLLAAGAEQADVLVLEGDVFFDAAVLHGLLTAAYVDVTAVERWQPWHSGTSVTRRDDGTVDRWMHEKERPAGLCMAHTFKTTNLHRFSREFMTNWLVPALAAQVARHEEAPLESVFAAIVSRGALVQAVDVEGRWAEIDDIEDLQRAHALFTPQQEQVTL